MKVQGTCEPAFAAVRAAFEKNFEAHGEVGAAVAVYHEGKPVVDLWGGLRDADRGLPWERDTIALMMSVSKGISATAVAMAYDRGLVDLDAPLARYWPAFAAAGKERITVRQALSHVAGVPVAERAQEGDIYSFDTMAAALAAQAPLWPPGSRQEYHSATLGYLMGMIIRGVTGKSIGRFIREELSGPLGADFQIGLTPEERARCAKVIPSAGNQVSAAKRAPQDSIAYRAWKPLPPEEDFNSERFRAAEIPSINGHGTARAVARIYGALAMGGSLDGVTLGRAQSFKALATEQPRGTEDGASARLRMGLAYMLNSPPHRPMGPHPEAFGHSGAGGHMAFADPVSRLGFAYCCNRMHDGNETGIRTRSLIDAVFTRFGVIPLGT
jgi:CubicO group peptidase (beta-lactamase class C family)